MVDCDEGFHEGWRKAEGYWGIVLKKSGFVNTALKRKEIYTHWKRNTRNFQEKYYKRKEKSNEVR